MVELQHEWSAPAACSACFHILDFLATGVMAKISFSVSRMSGLSQANRARQRNPWNVGMNGQLQVTGYKTSLLGDSCRIGRVGDAATIFFFFFSFC